MLHAGIFDNRIRNYQQNVIPLFHDLYNQLQKFGEYISQNVVTGSKRIKTDSSWNDEFHKTSTKI